MQFTIGTYAFTPYEQQLITEQLKVISNRVDDSWLFAGENLDATLVLAKKPITVGNQSILVLFGNHDKHTIPETATIQADWPIRIMGLLDIVQQAKKLISNKKQDSSDTSNTEKLTEILKQLNNDDVIISQNQKVLAIVKIAQSKINLSTSFTVCELANELLTSSFYIESFVQSQQAVKTDGTAEQHLYPLTSVLWEISLAEKITHGDRLHWLEGSYQLTQWPDLKALKSNTNLLRMAALFAKKKLSVQEVAQLIKTDTDTVIKFLKACSTAGLKFEKHAEPSAATDHKQPPGEDHQQQLSLLASLRKKLLTALS
jgi:hypothetical protein